jgi:hypothetical protein
MLLEAQGRGDRGIALPMRNFGARWEWVNNATPQPLYPGEIFALRFVQETGWAPGPVWTCKENKKYFFLLHNVSNSDHEAHSNYILIHG